MKLYKYVPLHFVIRHHYSRLSWAFSYSYWWLLRCVTRSRYHPRASVPRHCNHWVWVEVRTLAFLALEKVEGLYYGANIKLWGTRLKVYHKEQFYC